jgi:predicted metal-binding membrane protein
VLRALLRHDRIVVFVGLLAVIILAWGWLLLGAGIEMAQMDMGGGEIMLMAPEWSISYATLIFLMWAIMMMAMMLPSAAPAILLAAALMRQRGGNHIYGPTGLFVLGYLVVWFSFSLVATALQWGLDRAGLLSADMSSGGLLAALLLFFPVAHRCRFMISRFSSYQVGNEYEYQPWGRPSRRWSSARSSKQANA